MEEKEYNIVTLEDNLEYAELETIIHNNIEYVLLSEVNNEENFCIRKIKKKNNEEYIVGLDSDEEFDTILKLLTEKYTN